MPVPYNLRNRRRGNARANPQDDPEYLIQFIIITLVGILFIVHLSYEVMLYVQHQWPGLFESVCKTPPNVTIPEAKSRAPAKAVEKSMVMMTIYKYSGQIGLPLMLLREWLTYFQKAYNQR